MGVSLLPRGLKVGGGEGGSKVPQPMPPPPPSFLPPSVRNVNYDKEAFFVAAAVFS